MKIGDLVRVKDSVGYNSYMQNLVGHIGIVLNEKWKGNDFWIEVHILGKSRPIVPADLEVVNESR